MVDPEIFIQRGMTKVRDMGMGNTGNSLIFLFAKNFKFPSQDLFGCIF
jgi:hypothetical protein